MRGNRLFLDAVLRALGLLGVHAVKRTDVADMRALMRRLQPVDPGVELIRVGPETDGGYLIPDDLDGIEHALSPGVSTWSGFDEDLAARGLVVHLADHSVDQPGSGSENLRFLKKNLGSFPDGITVTLDQWTRSTVPDDAEDLLLQMDIEGAEYEVLTNVSSELLARFRIIVIELHYLHQLWNKPWFVYVSRVFDKLLRQHRVVHIHPNNYSGSFRSRGLEIPRVAEFTFYRRDRLPPDPGYRTDFPHALDRDNG
ncbi:MAG TPA: FkbM family methyltransferase, partial [Longimicrobiales bacterium]|nr:FkbM family methyltransferase [Longimicrobiales bacterium]